MDCGLVSAPSIPSNVVIIPTDAGCGTHLTALLILTMKTAPFWILASTAALTVDPTKFSGIGDGNHTCHLPRFNAKDFLERSRNGRVVFAGYSIGRNQWESLLCMLASGVSSVSTIYEVKGKVHKQRGYLSTRSPEFNLTVEYYRTPFLFSIHPYVGWS